MSNDGFTVLEQFVSHKPSNATQYLGRTKLHTVDTVGNRIKIEQDRVRGQKNSQFPVKGRKGSRHDRLCKGQICMYIISL